MTDDLKTYLAARLTADGYSGLCGEGCGCSLEDLMDCNYPSPSGCTPGYIHICAECPRTEDDCPMEGYPDITSCVTATREYPETEHHD